MEVFEIEKKVTLKIFLFFLLQDIYQKENVVLFQSVTFLTQQQMSSHQFIQCKEFERDEYVSKVTIVTDLFFSSHP